MGGTLETGDLYNSDRTSPCCSCLSRSIQVDCGYAWFEFRLAEARARRGWGCASGVRSELYRSPVSRVPPLALLILFITFSKTVCLMIYGAVGLVLTPLGW